MVSYLSGDPCHRLTAQSRAGRKRVVRMNEERTVSSRALRRELDVVCCRMRLIACRLGDEFRQAKIRNLDLASSRTEENVAGLINRRRHKCKQEIERLRESLVSAAMSDNSTRRNDKMLETLHLQHNSP